MANSIKSFRIMRSGLLAASSILALTCGMMPSPAHAITAAPTSTTWTGNGMSGVWSDPNNWSNGVLPSSTVSANFSSPVTATISTGAGEQYGSVTVDGGASLTLLPGRVLNDDMVVGETGTGSFSNNDATHNVTGNLILGDQQGSNGTYSVTGSSASTTISFAGAGGTTPSETPNGALVVGNNGAGTFTQGTDSTDAGNQVSVAGDLAVGLNSGSTGTYTINSGTLTVGGAILLGEGSTNNNVFTQNGGTVNITGTASGDSRYASALNTTTGGTFGQTAGILYVGAANTDDNGVGIYNLNGGSLLAQTIMLGFAGTGTLNQSGGLVNVGYVDLGACGGCDGGNSVGYYNLTGSGTLTTGGLTVGDIGHGEFLQNGAGTTNNVNGTLTIANSPVPTPNVANTNSFDRSGLYTLDSGNLNTQYTVVGGQGKGTFVQNGGTQAVSNALVIGQQNDQPLSTTTPVFGGPAPGLYTMTGGTLTVSGDGTPNSSSVDTNNIGILVGDAGNGTFNQSGGSVTSGVSNGQEGDLVIGAQAGSTGKYTLTDPTNSGTVSLNVYGNTDIGRDAANTSFSAAVGSLTIGNGTDTPAFRTYANGAAGGDVTVGDAGTGTLTVNSGTVNIAGNLNAGVNGTGTITQSGGSVSASYVDLSTAAGVGSSSYSISSGTLATTNDLNVGGASTGSSTFTQSGVASQTNVGGTLRIGNTNNTASFALSNGILNVTGDSYVGIGAFSGSMTQSGGSHSVGGTLYVGDGSSNGLYTLTGGTLSTGLNGGDNNLGDVLVGYGGTGELDNSGGQQISNSIYGTTIGWSGSGTYKLTGTGSLSVVANEYIGSFGSGTFVQGDGNGTTTNTVGGDFYMSEGYGGPASSYTLTDGTLKTTGSELIGLAADATFAQSGGNNSVGGDLQLGVLANSPTQFGNGTYNLSGTGSLSVTGNTELGVNSGTVGTLTQSGGTFTTQTLTVGGNGTGTFTQTGGNASVVSSMVIGSKGTATVTSLSAASIVNNNKFVLANASVTAPTVTNNGLLEGTGTITGDVTNSGTIHPGASPGILNITGNFSQNSNGLMDFTLSGTTPGTGYSQLNVTGSVGLAGSIELTDTTFPLSANENFDLINAGGAITGNISNVLFNNAACTSSSGLYACIANGQKIDFQEIISGGLVDFKVASVSAVPLPGALPLFGTALVGLIGFGSIRRRNNGNV